MEIVRKQAGGWIEVHVKGRLDSYWSNDLKKAFTELIQQGSHHIRVNLSEVTYLSSAGLGVLIGCRFAAAHCSKVRISSTTLAVGLGALGSDFGESQGRFGEFLAAAGAAAYLPTDGTNVPDYLVAAGSSVPEMQVCYAVICE